MDYLNNIGVLRGKVEYYILQVGIQMREKREMNPHANVLKEARLINQLSYAIEEAYTDQNISYIISLIPDLDLIPVTPFDPVVLDVVVGTGGSGGSTRVPESYQVTTDKVGGWKKGDTVEVNADILNVVKRALQEVFPPVIAEPTFSMSINKTLAKIGAEEDLTLTFNFNRGQISAGGVVQGYRAGAATEYVIDSTTQSTNTLEIAEFLIAKGNNIFYGNVTFGDGPQPLDSAGAAVGLPLEGATETESVSVEGVYPIYSDEAEKPLLSMLSANNVELVLIAETGGYKQNFEIPTAWLTTRPLLKIEFFNTFSNLWDSANKIANFAQTTLTKGGVAYTKFTNTDPDRGSLKIKLIF